MGRIKTTGIKRVGNKLVAQHRANFTQSFEDNKERLVQFVTIPSKKLRNVLAGYITHLMSREE